MQMHSVDLIKIIALSVSGLIFLMVIELIRRNRLKERYSLLWLAASVMLIVFSSWRGLLHYIALKLGISYPPSFLFLLSIAFFIALLLHFSTVISSQTDQNKRMAQEIGMLKSRLSRLENSTSAKDIEKQ
jgi:hypothetical protein